MTDHQFQALLSWLTRLDTRLKTVERDVRAVRHWVEPIPFAPEPVIEGSVTVPKG